jgi:beta-glucanase (GH16 family)
VLEPTGATTDWTPELPLPAWPLLFTDDFDGPAGPPDPAKWSRYNGPGHAGNGLRRPEQAMLDGNGLLTITAETKDGVTWSAGMSSRVDFAFGWVEARVRTDLDPTGTMSGLVLTWPASNHSLADGELDIWETGTSPLSRRPLHSFIHWPNLTAYGPQTHFIHDVDASEWHDVAMDWAPDAIRLYVDGQLSGVLTDPAKIPTAKHHVCLQFDAVKAAALPLRLRHQVERPRLRAAV